MFSSSRCRLVCCAANVMPGKRSLWFGICVRLLIVCRTTTNNANIHSNSSPVCRIGRRITADCHSTLHSANFACPLIGPSARLIILVDVCSVSVWLVMAPSLPGTLCVCCEAISHHTGQHSVLAGRSTYLVNRAQWALWLLLVRISVVSLSRRHSGCLQLVPCTLAMQCFSISTQ